MLTVPSSRFSRSLQWLALLGMLALGLGIRLYDLTDPPLDFHPTRQLRSAIIARDLYYRDLPSASAWQRERAVEQLAGFNLIEPPIFEKLAAFTYRLAGSDAVWIARIYASLFWLIGGLALFFLARRMTSSAGALITLAYYLFLPFGVIGSRSFQPDPLMVMAICLALWAIYRWYQSPGWKSALLAGGLAGLALFIKAVALFPVLAALGLLLLVGRGIKGTLRDRQVWIIAGLAVLPVIVYHLYGVYVLGSMESQFEGRFFPQFWVDPAFFVRWFGAATNIAGFGALLAGLAGVMLFAASSQRAFVLGLWVGYVAYGFTFSFHILTHTYYHLPLIPIVALSLAPLGSLVWRQLSALKPVLVVQAFVLGVLFVGIFAKVWDVRNDLAREDFRHEPAYWQQIADQLGRDSTVVALTHDYGNRLAYYGWITPRVWLPSKHIDNYRQLRGGAPIDVQKWFAGLTGDADYFLVTLPGQLAKQPELKEILYQNYTITAEGDGYLIFDLRHPLGTP